MYHLSQGEDAGICTSPPLRGSSPFCKTDDPVFAPDDHNGGDKTAIGAPGNERSSATPSMQHLDSTMAQLHLDAPSPTHRRQSSLPVFTVGDSQEAPEPGHDLLVGLTASRSSRAPTSYNSVRRSDPSLWVPPAIKNMQNGSAHQWHPTSASAYSLWGNGGSTQPQQQHQQHQQQHPASLAPNPRQATFTHAYGRTPSVTFADQVTEYSWSSDSTYGSSEDRSDDSGFGYGSRSPRKHQHSASLELQVAWDAEVSDRLARSPQLTRKSPVQRQRHKKEEEVPSESSSPLSERRKNKPAAETGSTKGRFKQFYKMLKATEKDYGFDAALEYARRSLPSLPKKVHFRVHLELADMAKRENRIDIARSSYERVNQLQPTANQGWMEYAKLEEECGNLALCTAILQEGLRNCPDNEPLMSKCLKHFERMGDLRSARALIGSLAKQPIDRCWRIILEGGMMEARQGNNDVARKVFKFLTRNVPWYGPIYQEACRFEEKCERDDRALKLVLRGLKNNARYGPLWFSVLRLREKSARRRCLVETVAAAQTVKQDMTKIRKAIHQAVKSISKELTWKVYFEAAQMEDRAGNLQEARQFYVQAVSNCPTNLTWKVWMKGAKTELVVNTNVSRELLKRALSEVPAKMRALVLLDYSRMEEFAGRYTLSTMSGLCSDEIQLDVARQILSEARKHTKHEWKVFLESVLLEIRANDVDAAMAAAEAALVVHSGTGRLWAVMIQLKEREGVEAQKEVLRAALTEVPKSGEVWCEGARIALREGDFEGAKRCIQFAIQFTPQYGDSFIEYVRMTLMEFGDDRERIAKVEQACVNADPNYGTLWLHCKQHMLDATRQVLRVAMHKLMVGPGRDYGSRLQVADIYADTSSKSDALRLKAIFL